MSAGARIHLVPAGRPKDAPGSAFVRELERLKDRADRFEDVLHALPVFLEIMDLTPCYCLSKRWQDARAALLSAINVPREGE